MPVLYRASFAYLLRHPWQLALALVGICIGVAVIVAVDLTNESARRAFALSMDTINGEATHQIVAGPRGVDEALYTQLRVEAGMRTIAPVVEGYAQIGNTTLRLLGVDVFAEREFRTYTIPEAVVEDDETYRRLLTDPGALLMSARTAASLGLAKGNELNISIAGKAFPAVLVGLLESSDRAALGLDGLVIVDIAVAQNWLDKLGRLTRIDVRLPEAESGEALADEIRRALSVEAQLLSATGRTQAVAEMSNAFITNLTAMSLLALLVGIFLIYNSMGFAVLQRRRLIGVLRALGVTRRQIFLLILNEGLLLGLIGAILGVMFGPSILNGFMDLAACLQLAVLDGHAPEEWPAGYVMLMALFNWEAGAQTDGWSQYFESTDGEIENVCMLFQHVGLPDEADSICRARKAADSDSDTSVVADAYGAQVHEYSIDLDRLEYLTQWFCDGSDELLYRS